MEKAEMQTRVFKAKSKIGAAMTMLFFGKIDQALEILKEALKELAPIPLPEEETIKKLAEDQ